MADHPMPRALNGAVHRYREEPHTRVRLLRVEWPEVPVAVLIQPQPWRLDMKGPASFDRALEAAQNAADRIAEIIRDTVEAASAVEAENSLLREGIQRERSARVAAQSRLEHMLGHRRRLHGAVVVRPDDGAVFDGPVWLLGKGRDWGSLGIRYESLAELWRECPDYRPVAWGVDDLGPWLEIAQLPMTDGSTPRLGGVMEAGHG